MTTRVIKAGVICAVGVGVLAGSWYFPAAVSTHDTPSLSTDESFQHAEAEAMATDLSDLLRLPPHLHPDAVVGQRGDVSGPEAAADVSDQGEAAMTADTAEQLPDQPITLSAPGAVPNKPFLAALGGGIAGTEPLTGVHRPASSMKRSSAGNTTSGDAPEDAEEATDEDVVAGVTGAEDPDATGAQDQQAESSDNGDQGDAPGAVTEDVDGEPTIADAGEQPTSPDTGAGGAPGGDGTEPEAEPASEPEASPEVDVTDAGQPDQGDALSPVVALDDPLADSHPPGQNGGGTGSPAAKPDEQGSKQPEQGNDPAIPDGISLDDPFSVVPPADIAVLDDEFTQKPTPTPAPEKQLPGNPGSPVGKADPASAPEADEPEDVEVVAVPEPSSLGAMFLGIAGLVWLRRKRIR